MKTKCVTLSKEPESVNEDAVMARSSLVAVADGAGGGGVFAERWSEYLLTHLPDKPFASFEQLDNWIERIWEPFFNSCERIAKQRNDGMLLSKFYEEGSFSTLAAIWISDKIRWATYGDSVAFHYDFSSGILQFSFPHLSDFSHPPFLISCKDPLDEKGFRCGEFEAGEKSAFFVTSDALAHYIMMMYMVSKQNDYRNELDAVLKSHSRNAIYVETALSMQAIHFDDVVRKLCNCLSNKGNFNRHLAKLRRLHLLAIDDYSFAAIRQK